MKCNFPKEMNDCPYCDKENMKCNMKSDLEKDGVLVCTFREDENSQPKKKYTWEERWFL